MKAEIHTLHINQIREMDFSWMKEAMPERWKKAQRFLREEDLLLCLGAGFLLRQFAGIESEKEISFNEYGKPFAPGKKDFSLSHSSELCAIAVNERKIGLDVEKMEETFPIEAKMIFTEEEKNWAGDSAERSYQIWTMKESVLKAAGLGFSIEPTTFSVLPAVLGGAVTFGGESWQIESEKKDGYCFSVCKKSSYEFDKVATLVYT